MGEKIGRKEIKKRKKKGKKKGEINKTKGNKGRWKGGGEEDRMKNRKEKERKKSWDQVLKPRHCVGTDPVHW